MIPKYQYLTLIIINNHQFIHNTQYQQKMLDNSLSIHNVIGIIQTIGSNSCRILQRLLVILIFFLFAIFSYAYLQNLFITHPHYQPIKNQTKIIYLSIGIWLLYNLMYNYVMANRIGPGFSQQLTKQILDKSNVKKRCKKCGLRKPIRTHHCSVCNKCVMQMDHHCPWMGVCIGHSNRRYFINFLTYLAFACFLVVKLIVSMSLPRSEVYMFMLTIGVIISLFGLYHWVIALLGRTTLELCQILDGYKPSKSIKTNFLIIFGTTNFIKAILPIYIQLNYKGCQWEPVQLTNLNQMRITSQNQNANQTQTASKLQIDQSILVNNPNLN